MGITDKVVVVTGGASGIGRATCRLLAGRGARIVLGDLREAESAAAVAGIIADGGRASHMVVDVRRPTEVAALVEDACSRHGRLDVMVNNAGVAPLSRLDSLRVDEWDETIDVNLKGVLNGIAAALPVFRRQGNGHIVNIASVAGLSIQPTTGVYAATKNAVRTITEALRQEAGANLRVTEISPGFVKTGIVSSINDPEVKSALKAKAGPIAIDPEAIARGVLYAIDQPDDVEVGSIVIRPTAQN